MRIRTTYQTLRALTILLAFAIYAYRQLPKNSTPASARTLRGPWAQLSGSIRHEQGNRSIAGRCGLGGAMSEAWKGQPVRTVNGRPFGRKAMRWLKDKLRHRVGQAKSFQDGSGDKSILPHVIQWYQDRALDFVDWFPSDKLQKGYLSGAWEFCEIDFCREWPNAFKWGHDQLQAKRAVARNAVAIQAAKDEGAQYVTLDAWLDAERTGQLKSMGVLGGSAQFSDNEQGRLARERYRRGLHWPKNCRDCDVSFRPTTGTEARCEACRTKRRTASKQAKRQTSK